MHPIHPPVVDAYAYIDLQCDNYKKSSANGARTSSRVNFSGYVGYMRLYLVECSLLLVV